MHNEIPLYSEGFFGVQAAPDAARRFSDAFYSPSLERLNLRSRRVHQELHLLLDGARFEAFESYFFTPSVHIERTHNRLSRWPILYNYLDVRIFLSQCFYVVANIRACMA